MGKGEPGGVMDAARVSAEWRTQAERDLEVARLLHDQGYFEWAAYAAQQAAEKAIKAARHALAIDTRENSRQSHDLVELSSSLLTACPNLFEPLEKGRLAELRQHEADARYPGVRRRTYQSPCRAYDESQASRGLATAEIVVDRCLGLTRELEGFWRSRGSFGEPSEP